MILRPYQDVAVNSAIKSLNKHKNTIVVAPTGAGKTIMLSSLIGKMHKENNKVLVLQHRDELVNQNMDKFKKINPNISTSILNADEKDWSGDVVFAMVQTLSRPNNLSSMQRVNLIIIDESHHTIANSWLNIIKESKEINPNVRIAGFTATPNRGDGKGLKEVFSNCSHQIEIETLIREGFLVSPKPFVIDVGVQKELSQVRKTIDEFNMDEVARIMNKRPINEEVVNKWHEQASDRKTVVFCSTKNHAKDLCDEFVKQGVRAEVLTGDTKKDVRVNMLQSLSNGDLQVVINVAVLTEGFDSPPVSCIILTRPCSYKSTMVQMIGRGLRTIDPNEYPNIIKKDCIILDFGTSILTHGKLDEEVNLDDVASEENGQAPQKQCPECNSIVPLGVRECPICGHDFAKQEEMKLKKFNMTEVELINKSQFRWIRIFESDKCLMASGFNGFAMVIDLGDNFLGLTKLRNGDLRAVSIGNKREAIASADDFLRKIESSNKAKKNKQWLNEPVSEKQRRILINKGYTISPFDFSWTKYKASCLLDYLFNKKKVDHLIYKKKREIKINQKSLKSNQDRLAQLNRQYSPNYNSDNSYFPTRKQIKEQQNSLVKINQKEREDRLKALSYGLKQIDSKTNDERKKLSLGAEKLSLSNIKQFPGTRSVQIETRRQRLFRTTKNENE
jgi:superfamily II DNA or RNA helicase|tara:strand:- start:1397 stop:3418 length:2022 start_codon:yes stop_codon:yes gene_type:complete